MSDEGVTIIEIATKPATWHRWFVIEPGATPRRTGPFMTSQEAFEYMRARGYSDSARHELLEYERGDPVCAGPTKPTDVDVVLVLAERALKTPSMHPFPPEHYREIIERVKRQHGSREYWSERDE